MSVPNNIWRFEPETATEPWTLLDVGRDKVSPRIHSGAGCNVPLTSTGFYLGGVSTAADNSVHYNHQLTIFNMRTESIYSKPVPDYVPVVNQRLVHLRAGEGHGVLVALAGQTERNKILSVAPLSQIYIYDIATDIWTKQDTFGLDASISEDGSAAFEPSLAFPMRRLKACATATSAADQSSHNIVVFGGENDTGSVSDVWLLTLPAMVWIKAPLSDKTNTPRSDGACLLLHERLVLMSEGCWVPSVKNSLAPRLCMKYSYDNLIYDITKLGWAHYDPESRGYLVPPQVSKVIGGDPLGRANRTTPLFGSFADPSLELMFEIPKFEYQGTGGVFSLGVQIAALTCLLAPFGLYILCLIVFKAWRAARGTTRSPRLRRPWARSQLYMLAIVVQSAALIALLRFIWHQSSLPDPNPAHLKGGLASEGTWSNASDPLHSWFSRAVNSTVPRNGLLSAYFDAGLDGTSSQKNFTIRISPGAFWGITYLPTLSLLIYGRLWRFLDVAIKRAMPVALLKRSHGCEARRSLLLCYHNFWTPLALGQALYYRHWPVVVSSLGMLLSAYAVPIVANYCLAWQLYYGGELEWGGQFPWMIAAVVPSYARALIALLGVTLICPLVLLFVERSSGMTDISSEYGSLAEVKQLVLDFSSAAELGFPLNPAWIPFTELERGLEDKTYAIVTHEGESREVLCAIPSCAPRRRQHGLSPPARIANKFKSFTNRIEKYPYSFMLRKPAFAIWLILLILLLTSNIYILTGLRKSQRDQTLNYAIPFSPNLFIIFAITAQSIHDLIEDHIRHLTTPVSLTLSNAHRSARVLFVDYTAPSLPIWESLLAAFDGRAILALTQLSTIATMIYTVFFGSLQLSASAYGATSFQTDLVAATVACGLMCFILAVNLLIGWQYVLCSPRLRQPPDCLAARIALVIDAAWLMEDVNSIKDVSSMREKMRSLRNRRYALGVFEKAYSTGSTANVFGIERVYKDHEAGVELEERNLIRGP